VGTFSCSHEQVDYGYAEWREDVAKDIGKRRRSEFGLALHQRGDLVGKTRQTLLELLGKPDRESVSKEMVYGLGPDPSFGIDIWDLRVELDENDCVRTTAVDVY
jgi:hypothetical protein